MAGQLLAGKSAADIPIEHLVLVPTFDWRALERWNIDISGLPPGSDIQFRPPAAWEHYRWYIVGILSLIVFQSLLITGLLAQRRQRHRAEEEVRAKQHALEISYREVQLLADRLITAQEEERTRIAGELHDDVGQRVASICMGLSLLRRGARTPRSGMRDGLLALQQQAMTLARDLRDLSHELHPSVMEHVGLLEAIRARCDDINSEGGVRVSLEVDDGWSSVPEKVALCLYRVTQEALRNISKHANARAAVISLSRHDGQVKMAIADDGVGFAKAEQRGLGVVSMRERVRMLGGSFDARNSPRGGGVIAIAIPLQDDPVTSPNCSDEIMHENEECARDKVSAESQRPPAGDPKKRPDQSDEFTLKNKELEPNEDPTERQ